jgi:hypothetical protein
MSIVRVLFVAIAFAALNLSSFALGQTQAPTQPQTQLKVSEQQSSQGLTPLLGQITSRNCPDLMQGDIEKASASIYDFKRDIPTPIQQLLEAWLDYSKYYKHMHYIISISIIVFGALATALADEQNSWWRRWKTMAAVLATIAAGVNTTLAPNIDYKKFDEAFVVLNTAKAAYMTNPYVTLCDVGKAVAYGESLIHKGE